MQRGGNSAHEAYTGSTQAVQLSSEIAYIARADAVVVAEGCTGAPRGQPQPGAEASPESENRACLHGGPPGTLGYPAVSSFKSDRAPRQCVQASGVVALHAHGSEQASAAGTVGRRQPSTAGGTARKSELSTVPEKQGNPTRGTLWRERGASQRNCWRERCAGVRARSASQRNCSR